MSRALLVACCLLAASLQAGNLVVVQVVREGEPPYEDNNRLYRLEGDLCATLRLHQPLLLVRFGEARPMGQLEVVKLGPDFALARVSKPGASYPMKGDRAVPREGLTRLPPLPGSTALAGAPHQPAEPALMAPPPSAPHREPIYFLPEQAVLSPAAKTKLKAWVAAWGRAGHWVLVLPKYGPSAQDADRVRVLREELKRLGVARVEQKNSDLEAPGQYPAVFVGVDPA